MRTTPRTPLRHVRRALTARPGRARGALRLLSLAVIALVAVSACSQGGSQAKTARQAQVEARGAKVMPFDQNKTTHVFEKTTTGGVQRVVAKDPRDARQIRLIRGHLRDEAARFAVGDFTDPMAIHGMAMPGIAELRQGASRMDVRYAAIPLGARITYRSTEPRLVRALHDWFDAQLMDHGANAHG
jgi:hypothetical protein